MAFLGKKQKLACRHLTSDAAYKHSNVSLLMDSGQSEAGYNRSEGMSRSSRDVKYVNCDLLTINFSASKDYH